MLPPGDDLALTFTCQAIGTHDVAVRAIAGIGARRVEAGFPAAGQTVAVTQVYGYKAFIYVCKRRCQSHMISKRLVGWSGQGQRLSLI